MDARFVLFGSTNLTNQSIEKNNEANLLIDDRKLAAEIPRYYEHLWSGGKHNGIQLQDPWYADGAFKEMLLQLIADAKSEIQFSIYFFNQKDIEKALIDAHKRGVRGVHWFHPPARKL